MFAECCLSAVKVPNFKKIFEIAFVYGKEAIIFAPLLTAGRCLSSAGRAMD